MAKGTNELWGGSMREFLRKRLGREVAKAVLSPLLRWRPQRDSTPGYSIVLGVPWDLRHLLGVNLRFLERTDLRDLHRIHVIFDRRHRTDMDLIESRARSEFPELPLYFQAYPAVTGRIIERLDISTFYNSMNTVTALADCETRYAILHDFDLYPLVPDYFSSVFEALRTRELRFSGIEHTLFDGLTEEDALIGTWCLGIDADWLRANYRPIQCFHKVAMVGGRRVNLDPYSWIQTRTPARELVGTVDGSSCAHVKNLCSTYLRFVTGRPAELVWRLHFAWYLGYLSGEGDEFTEATVATGKAESLILEVGGHKADFRGTDPGAAGFLRTEVERMEIHLFGAVRPEVERFLEAFERFLRMG